MDVTVPQEEPSPEMLVGELRVALASPTTGVGELVGVRSDAPAPGPTADAVLLPPWGVAYRAAKRTIDIVVALAALLLLAPLMAIVAIAVRAETRGPVIFRQRRCGWKGRDFPMLKFRSMVDGAEQLVINLADDNESDGLLFKIRQDPRITRVGRVIRRTSIDELPQLVNVLRGDMSLVGPRPLPVSAESFGALDGQRHSVRPGLTGYWQVSGRSSTGYDAMVDLDLRYIREASLGRDLLILVRTLPAVISARNAY